MKRPKVYLIVMSLLLTAALMCLLYVWGTVQFFHTKTKEASRDAYAPHEIPVLDDEVVKQVDSNDE